MDAKDPAARLDGTPPPRRPAGLVGSLYRREWAVWRAHYRRYFKSAARALGLGFVAGFLYFMIWPAQEKKALALVIQALKDIPLDASPLVMTLTLFYHNARASALALAAGAIPFLFLPILDPLLNGGVIGLLVSVARHQRLNVPKLVITQILPHGVFELGAVLYAASMGLYLSASMGRKVRAAWVRKRARATGAPPAPESGPLAISPESPASPAPESPAANVLRSFVLVVLPLLLLAAFIEAFVTPNLR